MVANIAARHSVHFPVHALLLLELLKRVFALRLWIRVLEARKLVWELVCSVLVHSIF